MLDAFTKQLGIHQGRIRTGPNTYAYELGHAQLADVLLNVGDYHEISQDITVASGTRAIRVALVVKTPEELPVGSGWEVSAWFNGSRMVHRRLRPSKREIRLDDWRISTLGAVTSPGTNVLAFRLELV